MRGRWPGAEALIGDCADAAAVLRAAHPELPLALFGASMGGSVALAGLASGRVGGVDRLIRAAPGVRGGVQLRQLHDLPCAWARSRGSGSGWNCGAAAGPGSIARNPDGSPRPL
jgi:alpha-beta hydrolase superfamily lysophospholipase